MTADTRLRELADRIVAMAPDAPPCPEVPPVAPTHRRSIRPFVVFVAAAAAVLILIGGVVWLSADEEGDVVDQPSYPVVSTPETSISPVIPEGSVPGPWTTSWKTTYGIPGSYPAITSVGQTESGFVAVGMTFTRGDGWARPQIWMSDDGETWQMVGSQSVYAEGHSALGAISNQSGIVVFGNIWRSPDTGNVIWHSVDGADWDLVAVGEPVLEGDWVTDGLALTSGGFVLYGVPPLCSVVTGECFPEEAPRVLVSTDGISWEMTATPVTFTAVTEIDGGNLIAVGGSMSEPTTWISTDGGRGWRLHGPDRSTQGDETVEVWVLEATSFGLVAAGLNSDQQPTLWLSEDNKTFEPTLDLPLGIDEYNKTHIDAITSGNGWVIAVGGVDINTPNPQPVMWASQDGKTWQTVNLEGTYFRGATLTGVIQRDSVFVAVGNHSYSPGNAGNPLTLRWESAPS